MLCFRCPPDQEWLNSPDYRVLRSEEPHVLFPDLYDEYSILKVGAPGYITWLHRYYDGDESVLFSSSPVADRQIDFRVNEQHGVVPGTLSVESSITDENGEAEVVLTAPDPDLLDNARVRIFTATVTAICRQSGAEDTVYVRLEDPRGRGKVMVEPSVDGVLGTAYGGSRGIVPPDSRFPAMIRATLESKDLEPLANTEVTVEIANAAPVGLLRSPEGEEGVRLEVLSDEEGRIELHYFFSSDVIPEEPTVEMVRITSEHLKSSLEARVSIGLNLVIDDIESAYEGRGVVSAGEHIPLRVRVGDKWNPDVDLSQIINYWGLGVGTGDTRLYVRLEIENVSSIPEYLLDQLRQEFYPEQPFDEHVEVISSRRLEQTNLLWVPDSSLRPYRGYPRVRPVGKGNQYYQARVSLVDQHGDLVFESNHPAVKGFFNIQTDVPADAIYMYFVNNPLRPQTEAAEYYSIALNLLGMGSLISVVDALDAINRGDANALFEIMFSEIRGFLIGQAKKFSPDFKVVMTRYSRLMLADQIAKQIQGSIELRTEHVEQKLLAHLDKAYGDDDVMLRVFETREDPGFPEVPIYPDRLHYDDKTGIASLESGGRYLFLMPSSRPYTSPESRTMLLRALAPFFEGRHVVLGELRRGEARPMGEQVHVPFSVAVDLDHSEHRLAKNQIIEILEEAGINRLDLAVELDQPGTPALARAVKEALASDGTHQFEDEVFLLIQKEREARLYLLPSDLIDVPCLEKLWRGGGPVARLSLLDAQGLEVAAVKQALNEGLYVDEWQAGAAGSDTGAASEEMSQRPRQGGLILIGGGLPQERKAYRKGEEEAPRRLELDVPLTLEQAHRVEQASLTLESDFADAMVSDGDASSIRETSVPMASAKLAKEIGGLLKEREEEAAASAAGSSTEGMRARPRPPRRGGFQNEHRMFALVSPGVLWLLDAGLLQDERSWAGPAFVGGLGYVLNDNISFKLNIKGGYNPVDHHGSVSHMMFEAAVAYRFRSGGRARPFLSLGGSLVDVDLAGPLERDGMQYFAFGVTQAIGVDFAISNVLGVLIQQEFSVILPLGARGAGRGANALGLRFGLRYDFWGR